MFGDLFQPTELIVAVILVAIFWLIVSDVRSAWRGRGPASSDCYFHWYFDHNTVYDVYRPDSNHR